MANEKDKSRREDQHSLQAKELQKYFSKLQGVMLVPGDKKFHGFEYAVLCLLFDEKNYANFTDYKINNNIVQMLDDKYPILSIRVDESNKLMAGLCIMDEDSGLRFTLPDQGISEPLLNFVRSTKPMDKIVIIAGCLRDGQIVFEDNVRENPLLILDGFIFE